MGKKIKLKKGRRSWEPPPSLADRILPWLVVLAILLVILQMMLR